MGYLSGGMRKLAALPDALRRKLKIQMAVLDVDPGSVADAQARLVGWAAGETPEPGFDNLLPGEARPEMSDEIQTLADLKGADHVEWDKMRKDHMREGRDLDGLQEALDREFEELSRACGISPERLRKPDSLTEEEKRRVGELQRKLDLETYGPSPEDDAANALYEHLLGQHDKEEH